MAKRRTQRRRQRRHRRRTMKGGAFSQQELQQLQNNGFNEFQIEELDNLGISFNVVMQRVDAIMNQGPDGFHGNSDGMAEQVMVELRNENTFDNPNAEDIDAIPHDQDDIHDMDLSFNDDNGSLHMSDLDVTQDSMRANTTSGDESFGNSQMSDGSMSSLFSENESFASETGGKRRRRKASRKGRKTSRKGRKTRKQRGGMCYGNGVGANSYDPNYSIYNTNMLKLFPYKS